MSESDMTSGSHRHDQPRHVEVPRPSAPSLPRVERLVPSSSSVEIVLPRICGVQTQGFVPLHALATVIAV